MAKKEMKEFSELSEDFDFKKPSPPKPSAEKKNLDDTLEEVKSEPAPRPQRDAFRPIKPIKPTNPIPPPESASFRGIVYAEELGAAPKDSLATKTPPPVAPPRKDFSELSEDLGKIRPPRQAEPSPSNRPEVFKIPPKPINTPPFREQIRPLKDVRETPSTISHDKLTDLSGPGAGATVKPSPLKEQVQPPKEVRETPGIISHDKLTDLSGPGTGDTAAIKPPESKEEISQIRQKAEAEAGQLLEDTLKKAGEIESECILIRQEAKAESQKLTEEARRQAQEIINNAQQEAAARIQEEASQIRKATEAEAERIKEEAQRQAEEILRGARTESENRAHEESSQIISAARAEAESLKEKARLEADEMTESALREAESKAQQESSQIASAARAEAERIKEEAQRQASASSERQICFVRLFRMAIWFSVRDVPMEATTFRKPF